MSNTGKVIGSGVAGGLSGAATGAAIGSFIPGIGTNYKFTNNLSVFGGVHKGFSPPGNQDGQESEESVNYELGTRFNLGKLKGELVGFLNDYSNLLGSDLTATGGTTNDIVFVVTEGLLSGLDTSTSTAGDPVWLGVNGALIFGLLNKRGHRFSLI